MKIVKSSLIFFLAGLCLTGMAAAAQKPIVVATDATWPLMEMMDKNNAIVGFDIDLFNAVAKEAGLTVEYKNTPWDKIFTGLEAGKYDAIISSVTITDERKKKYAFTDPYFTAGQILVTPKASTARTPAELKGLKVGAQADTTGAMIITRTPGVVLKTYDDIQAAFADLASGKIQGIVCDTPAAANYVFQNPQYKDKFKIASAPLTQEPYGIVVKKGNQALLELLNKGIKAVKAKGIDKQLEKKWLR
jgi:polar amino acid transport system substrate-binding protein